VLYVVAGRLRILELDLVEDVDNADDVRRDELRFVALVLPVGRAGERDEALVDLRVDGGGNDAVEHQRLKDVAAKVGVVALVVVQQLDLQLVVDGEHAEDALGGLLRLTLLAKAADRPAHRDCAAVRRDGDRGAVELGVPEELVADVCSQLGVEGHWGSPFIESANAQIVGPARARRIGVGAESLRRGRRTAQRILKPGLLTSPPRGGPC
jgi:hypothetical protein